MALSLPARTELGVFPTPLRRNSALADVLGVDDLWVKRDDLTGFSWGGNKVRTAEFLIGDALESGITDIVVSGGPSSNFAATMAAAGRKVGIVVHQVAYGSEPDVYPPALRVAVQAGAQLVFTNSDDRDTMETTAVSVADTLCRDGRTAVAIPRGGATLVGSNGFVAAATELADQMDSAGLQHVTIVLPVGSGGSISGLLAGRALLTADWSIIGASVSRPARESAVEIVAKAGDAVNALGGSASHARSADNVRLVDCRGEGFGMVTAEEVAFSQRVRDATGLLIDHTYNTKPLHWLSQHGNGLTGPVIYWLTGGALGAFPDVSSADYRRAPLPIDQKDSDL
jgi:1-aminocyclopropane-1-carboxylate deaminase/D-cysteine desulfhydrase-like pyridoxal-dependent ACC family enzyme